MDERSMSEWSWIYIIVTKSDFTKVDYDRISKCLETVLYRQHFQEGSDAELNLCCYAGQISSYLTFDQLQFLAGEENNHKWFSWRVM